VTISSKRIWDLENNKGAEQQGVDLYGNCYLSLVNDES
jgi:hypothetical protein